MGSVSVARLFDHRARVIRDAPAPFRMIRGAERHHTHWGICIIARAGVVDSRSFVRERRAVAVLGLRAEARAESVTTAAICTPLISTFLVRMRRPSLSRVPRHEVRPARPVPLVGPWSTLPRRLPDDPRQDFADAATQHRVRDGVHLRVVGVDDDHAGARPLGHGGRCRPPGIRTASCRRRASGRNGEPASLCAQKVTLHQPLTERDRRRFQDASARATGLDSSPASHARERAFHGRPLAARHARGPRAWCRESPPRAPPTSSPLLVEAVDVFRGGTSSSKRAMLLERHQRAVAGIWLRRPRGRLQPILPSAALRTSGSAM